MNLRHLNWIALASVALLATGCPKAPAADPIEPGPQITSFTASAGKVARGTTVTLTWATENTSTVKLEELKSGPVDGATDPSGSVDVQVDADSLFVLTATNNRGASERLALSVVVDSSAHDLMFYALPSQITAGESVTLTWAAPDATSASIADSQGGTVDLKGQVGTGSVTVTPAVSTTYTLTADSKTATTKVTVKPRIGSLSATPASAQAGSTLTIAWTTVGAAEVSLVGPGRGEILHETDAAKVASGSYSETVPAKVDPGTIYSYTLIAKDATGATTEQQLTVFVQGVPAVKTFTAPSAGRRGQTITLSWTTGEADGLSISADGTSFYQAPSLAKVASGSVTLPTPAAKTTYTLTATNSRGGSDSKTLQVDSVGAPAIQTFTASPQSVAAGSPVTLAWTTSSVRNISITEASDGLVYTGSVDSGSSFMAYPNHDSVYTLTADNGFGESATATAQVTVTNPMVLTASVPGAVISGTPVDLSWTGSGQIVGMPHSIVDVRSPSTGFDDIASTGSQLTFNDSDDGRSTITGANFHTTLFGKVLGTDIQVSTNGYLVFGKYVDGDNYTSQALPTSRIEPYSVAPFWADLQLGSGKVVWQVKGTATDPVLIVQWNDVDQSSNTPVTFQAKVHSTGQVDFEYKAIPSGITSAHEGIQGPDPRWAIVPTTAPANDVGLTFFGPKPSPVTVTPIIPATFTGNLMVGSGNLRLAYDFKSVLTPNDLVVTEAMSQPDPAVGAPGKWLELANRTNSAVDLTGWTVGLSDGGTLPLSGAIPAQGQLVVGSTTDSAQNGDAGVQLAIAGFDLATNETVSLKRSAVLNSLSWTSPGSATALVQDPGPFRFSTDSSSGATAVPRAQTCSATATYNSSPVLRGTPGQLKGCGFGYFLSRINESFYDISATGTPLITGTMSFSSSVIPLDVSAAPFPLFGTSRNTLYVSTKGLLTGDSAVTSSDYPSSAIPTTTNPGMMAIFAGSLGGSTTYNSQIYSKRVLANEDPAASAPHWVVQWSHYYYSSGDDFNFQIKLFDDGTIEYHFAEMRSDWSSYYGAGPFMVTWLKNLSGQALVINARSYTPGIGWHSAFRFSPR